MAKKPRILLIDDEEGLCRMLEAVLGDEGYEVRAYNRPVPAVKDFVAGRYDLVITDIKMPEMSGIEVLQKIKEKDPAIPVIVITAHATVDMSISAMRKGAYDMVTKPFEPDELLFRVKNALRLNLLASENQSLREELEGRFRFERIIGTSEKLRAVLDKVEKLAVRDTSILITGESGTGKELIAQAVHYNSPRKEGRFVAINCGALPESVLESELFGYKKGAFTGATEDKEGLLKAADGGTLFLDEVGNLPMNVQKTLLRFLQEQEFRRIGDTHTTKVDVRILSATNADLREAVKAGTFREDLYYRLNVVNIHLPPLRERKPDIALLADHFIREQNERFGTRVKGLSPEAMEVASDFSWPGNIRQLRNAIEGALAMESGDYITLPTLAQFIEIDETQPRERGSDEDYSSALSQFETSYLKELLRKAQGNVEEAARLAGMNMATIYRKLKKYNIRKEDYL
ncbi:sigma-54-dependent transcriptional regulator [Geoalkalibacter subterraneus]|uniref:Fis family transcriptional regulator n=1 Tax=Geoalkalibacter subterraneus TaxID=483547 RepID=A0A0B5FBP4_9BACT|nr:sigma-54 dependent transcriptional regulator [Geoalkalibacter subterraneus]AJF05572.1 Fis family transcriptional regulator [Geoalkalibacter subterraneus]